MEITMNCLDFRGEECPGPLVKTIRVLSKLRKGEKLVVLTTSKDCVEMLKQTIEVFE
jgi:TusA-related sulfurtransferase